jgi:G2/mitotic-specific cyclin 1/2
VLSRNGIKPNQFITLCDWILDVFDMWNLERQTLLLLLNYLSRFLASCSVPVLLEKLQLLAVVCLLIAYKFNEPKEAMYLVTLSKLTANAFSVSEIRATESAVLNELQFRIAAPTALHFVDRFITASSVHDAPGQANTAQIQMLSNFLIEVSATSPALFMSLPSLVAASSIVLARACLELPLWVRQLSR